MKKIIDLYRVTLFTEIIFSTLALGAFFYYRTNENFAGYATVLLLYLSLIVSLLIGVKIVKSTEAKIKAKEEHIIVGYITTIIKFLAMVVLIIAELYFIVQVTKGVNNVGKEDFLFYPIIITCLIWDVFSIFNCVFYFFITKMNKNIRLTEIENFGKFLN